MRKIAIVVGELEMRARTPGSVVRPQSQILIDSVRTHHLPRIHLPVRVPDFLELFEGFDQFRPKHFGQQLSARLPVAVFAGERTAIANHKIGSAMNKTSIVLNPARGSQVKIDSRMHAALPKMAVQRATIVEFVQQLPEIAKIIT